MNGRDAACAALEARLKLYARPLEPVHGQVGWGATVPEIVDVVPEPEGRAACRSCDHPIDVHMYGREACYTLGCFCANANPAVRSLPEGPPETCGSCGHRLPHDERWGCMAEVGDAGSGSVSDAVFCKCTGPALPEGPEDGQARC